MFPSAVNSTCVLLPKELSRHVWNQLFHNASFNGCGSGVFAWICVVFFCARHPMKYFSWYQIQIFFTSPPFAVNLSLHAKIWNCNKRHKWSSGIYCFSVPLERCQSFTEVGLSGLKQRMVVYYPRSAEFLKNKGERKCALAHAQNLNEDARMMAPANARNRLRRIYRISWSAWGLYCWEETLPSFQMNSLIKTGEVIKKLGGRSFPDGPEFAKAFSQLVSEMLSPVKWSWASTGRRTDLNFFGIASGSCVESPQVVDVHGRRTLVQWWGRVIEGPSLLVQHRFLHPGLLQNGPWVDHWFLLAHQRIGPHHQWKFVHISLTELLVLSECLKWVKMAASWLCRFQIEIEMCVFQTTASVLFEILSSFVCLFWGVNSRKARPKWKTKVLLFVDHCTACGGGGRRLTLHSFQWKGLFLQHHTKTCTTVSINILISSFVLSLFCTGPFISITKHDVRC